MLKTINGVPVEMTSEETAELLESNVVHEAGADDRAAVGVRSKRDDLLAKTDYYALTDVTMDSTVTTYRQALRDIPAQVGFPNTITWPTAP